MHHLIWRVFYLSPGAGRIGCFDRLNNILPIEEVERPGVWPGLCSLVRKHTCRYPISSYARQSFTTAQSFLHLCLSYPRESTCYFECTHKMAINAWTWQVGIVTCATRNTSSRSSSPFGNLSVGALRKRPNRLSGASKGMMTVAYTVRSWKGYRFGQLSSFITAIFRSEPSSVPRELNIHVSHDSTDHDRARHVYFENLQLHRSVPRFDLRLTCERK